MVVMGNGNMWLPWICITVLGEIEAMYIGSALSSMIRCWVGLIAVTIVPLFEIIRQYRKYYIYRHISKTVHIHKESSKNI